MLESYGPVDLIAANYAAGNYRAVMASFVAYQFSHDIKKPFMKGKAGDSKLSKVISRSYVLNPRESDFTKVRRDLKLLECRWDESKGFIELTNVDQD